MQCKCSNHDAHDLSSFCIVAAEGVEQKIMRGTFAAELGSPMFRPASETAWAEALAVTGTAHRGQCQCRCNPSWLGTEQIVALPQA